MDPCPHCGDRSQMPFCDCPPALEEARRVQDEAMQREAAQETITWIMDGSFPDDEQTVLACTASREVGEAFRDGGFWRWASSDLIHVPVKAWAHMPEGPKP